MNRIGLKDYLLNEASDSDLLDCAKVYDCYRFNGYGHLESVSNESLLEDARDEVDNIIDWLEGASRYELMDVSSDVELFVDAKDRAIEKHAEIEPKQRIVFDRMIGRVGDSYLEVVNQLDNFFDTDRTGQSEFINDNWGNPILVKGGRDGYGDTPCVLAVYEDFVDAMDTSSSDTGGDNIFADCIIDGIWDENGSLILTGALPDGHATICELLGAHACAEMRQLTDKGGRLYLDHLTVDGFHLPKDGIEAMGSSTEMAMRVPSCMTCGTIPRCVPARVLPRRHLICPPRSTSCITMA